MASNKKFGRSAKYVVLPVAAVRALNVRDDQQVCDAQAQVDDDMISALEEMVNNARAGKLEGNAALSMAAVAW